MSKNGSPKPLKARDRVIATRDVGVVAEGTAGTVKVANGLTWARYWVKFDNGEWIGSVSVSDLVREDDWETFKVRRAEEAARPKVAVEPTAVAASGDASAATTGPVSKVPAHLLERSLKARERRAAG